MPLPPVKFPKRLLWAGLLCTLLPIPPLYLLETRERKTQPHAAENGVLEMQKLMAQYVPADLGLKLFLWACVAVGILCLILAFRKLFPDPERILWEEEWDKKGK
jgi:4-amino-4-deoxy-L-arabinose transferase-like glycosyltransferase